jgi:hypothetical protein
MTTKEIFLTNHGNAYEYQWHLNVVPYTDALKAMDEWAEIKSEQTAIAFAEWISG